MSASGPAPAPPVDGVALGLLIAAGLLYAISLVPVLAPPQPDPQYGVALGIIMLLVELPLWVLLAAYLWRTVSGAGLARPIVAGAALLLPLAALASLMAFSALGPARARLPAVAIVLLPPLAMAFGAWARRSVGEPARPRQLVALGFALATLAVIAPVAVAALRELSEQAAIDAAARAEEARREAAVDALLASPETRLEQLLVYAQDEGPPHPSGLSMTGGRRSRVIAGIGRLPSRQADAVRLLADPAMIEPLEEMGQFGLAVTPELCRAYGAAFERLAGGLAAGRAEADETITRISRQSENLRWLTAGGCDLSPQIAQAIDAARRLPAETGAPYLIEALEELGGAGTAPPP